MKRSRLVPKNEFVGRQHIDGVVRSRVGITDSVGLPLIVVTHTNFVVGSRHINGAVRPRVGIAGCVRL